MTAKIENGAAFDIMEIDMKVTLRTIIFEVLFVRQCSLNRWILNVWVWVGARVVFMSKATAMTSISLSLSLCSRTIFSY